MSEASPHPSTKVVFWAAFVPVILALLLSLFMALEAIFVVGETTPLTLGLRFALLMAPIPQIFSLMKTFDLKNNDDWARATTRMLIQMIVVSVVIGAWLLWVLQ